MDNLIEDYIDKCFNTFNKRNDLRDLQHLIMGVSSESGEIIDLFKKVIGYGVEEDEKWKNLLIHELGDLIWYTTVLSIYIKRPCAFEVELSGNNRLNFDKFTISSRLSFYSNELYLKGHGTPEFISAIYSLIFCVKEICENYEFSIEEILYRNLIKLQKRHGSSFNKNANYEDGRNRISEES